MLREYSPPPCVTFQVLHVTCNFQTVRARKLKYWKKVHLSYVMRHMSCLTFPVSHMPCHVSLDLFFFYKGDSTWKVLGGKSTVKKLFFFALIWKITNQLDMTSHFCPHFISFLGPFRPFWVLTKNCICFGKLNLKYRFQDFKNQIWYFKLYIYTVFTYDSNLNIFFFNFDWKIFCW